MRLIPTNAKPTMNNDTPNSCWYVGTNLPIANSVSNVNGIMKETRIAAR